MRAEDMSIEATEYLKRGIMLVLRAALPESDPESWQSLWRAKYGSMEGFPYSKVGIPEPEECPTCHRPWAER